VGLVQGGADHGRALLEAGIDACVFTGSVAAGREVSGRCGERLIPCSVELGGKDAAIVLADCDLDRTLAGVTNWKLHNAGQNCGAIERLYVEQPVADEFVRRLGETWKRLRTTDGDDGDVSPLANPRQLEIVERHVADARAKGAAVVCGGARTGAGLGYLPTVLDRCTDEMAVMREETFGPVLAVVRVKDAEEALAAANRSDFGLGGSVWTKDLARGRALASRLECGVVNVNNHAVSGALVAAPWTGIKDTGGGVANSEYALSTFLRPRTVLVDRSTKPDMFWMPFDADLADTGDRLARLQLGQLGALFGLFGALKRRIRAIREFFANRP
jgi:acyl-CoA reductase-like NAD-dependent aldehyde dehydrogenase